jgi:hypothetical protein
MQNDEVPADIIVLATQYDRYGYHWIAAML